MPTCAFVSFRLGGTDGVSVVADQWMDAFRSFGFDVFTVAGELPADHVEPGLAIDAREPPSERAVRDLLHAADLVVVENLLTIPMNLPASRVVARVLRGRPAVLHHHDPPWQRDRYRDVGVELLAVSLDQSARQASQATADASYPVLHDAAGEVGRLYDVDNVPVMVLIDRGGVVRDVFEGFRRGNEQQYLERVQALLRE